MRLVVESTFSELETVVDAARNFFSRFSDNLDLIHKIMLLTSEAVTNGIKHGNGLDETKTVTCDFQCKEDTFEVWVEDQGEGFDRAAIPDPLSA